MKLLACLPFLIVSVSAVAQEISPDKSDVGSTTEAAADVVVLTDGTSLVLRNKALLSSKVCHVGDLLEFEVAKPVIASDLVVIAKGATATVRVSAAEPPHRKGQGGRLEVTFESVELVNGQTVPLHGAVSFKAGGRLEMVGDMLTIGYYTLGLGVPFVLLEKGHEAVFREGERFVAFLTGEVKVSRVDVAAYQPTVPKPRDDIAVIYVIKAPFRGEPVHINKAGGTEHRSEIPWPFTIGEEWFTLGPSAALRIELPPGKYWLKASNKNLRSAKLKELMPVDAQAGKSYYYEFYFVEKAGCRFKVVSPEAGTEMMYDVEVFATMPVEKLRFEQLRNLRVQPHRKK